MLIFLLCLTFGVAAQGASSFNIYNIIRCHWKLPEDDFKRMMLLDYPAQLIVNSSSSKATPTAPNLNRVLKHIEHDPNLADMDTLPKLWEHNTELVMLRYADVQSMEEITFFVSAQDKKINAMGTFRKGKQVWTFEKSPASRTPNCFLFKLDNTTKAYGSDKRRNNKHRTTEASKNMVDNYARMVVAAGDRPPIVSAPANPPLPGEGFPESDGSYTVKLMLVVDNILFKKYFDKQTATQEGVRWRKAYDAVIYYAVHFANLIDLRYRNIQSPLFSLRVKLVGVHIVLLDTEEPWAKAYSYAAPLDGRVSLPEEILGPTVEEFIRGEQDKEFDHVMLLVGHQLIDYDVTSGIGDGSLLGFSNYGSICDRLASYSVVEYTGAFASAQVGAHEIGHSLGADHDGEGNACSSREEYVMSGYLGSTMEEDHAGNHFMFSPCTVAAFYEKIIELTSIPGANCLLNPGKVFEHYTTNLQVPINSQLTPSKMCAEHRGPEYVYAGGQAGKNICQRLECLSLITLAVTLSPMGARGVPGTSCGDKQWCVNGMCVFSDAAPSVSDNCPQGDRAGPIPLVGSLTCGQLSDRSQCYTREIESECCNMCNSFASPIAPYGCRYGDVSPSFCATQTLAQCSNPDVARLCCTICGPPPTIDPLATTLAPTPPPICIDAFNIGCASVANPRSCETRPIIRNNCCRTCHNLLFESNTADPSATVDPNAEPTPISADVCANAFGSLICYDFMASVICSVPGLGKGACCFMCTFR